MTGVIVHLALLVLAIMAYLALCAGLPRYQHGLCGRKLTLATSRSCRLTGWVLLALLLLFASLGFGLGHGLVLLAAYSTVGAAIAVGLANRA